MYHDWKNSTDLSYQDRKRSFEKLRSYAEGTQSVAKYKDLLDVEGDSSYMNIDWTPVSIVPKFVDVVCGGMVNQEFMIRANAIDTMSIDKRKEDARELFADMMTAELRSFMTKKTGVDYNRKGFVPQDMEELELFMQMNYKQAQEVSLENGIEFVLQQNDFDELKKRLVRDLVVIGTAAVKTYIDSAYGVRIKYVNPSNLVTSYSESPDYRNIQHAGEIYTVSIAELKRMAGDQFTEEQYKEMAEKYGKKQDEDTLFGRGYHRHTSYSNDYDKFSVEIMDAEFISTHQLNYEKKENAFGGFSVRKRKGNYKAPKNQNIKESRLAIR